MFTKGKIKKLVILAGLLASPLAQSTPASAGNLQFNLNLSSGNGHSVTRVHQPRYRTVSPRRVSRILRREGLYPVSRIRFGRNTYRVRAENDYGDLFRVVGDIRNGQIYKVRPARAARYAPQPAPRWRGRRQGNNNYGYRVPSRQPVDPWGYNAPRPAWQGNVQRAPVIVAPQQNLNRQQARQAAKRTARKARKNRKARKQVTKRQAPPVVVQKPRVNKAPRIIPLKKIDPDKARAPDTDGSMR